MLGDDAPGRGMHTHIGHLVEPLPQLLIEIIEIAGKRPACDVLRRGARHLKSWLLSGVLLEGSRRRKCDGIGDHHTARKWTPVQKTALLAEVEAEGGKVVVVARRHGISESLLYNWRSAWKAAGSAMRAAEPVDFVPLGVLGQDGERRPMLPPPETDQSQPPPTGEGTAGTIEIALPNGARVCVDASVNEKALLRVLRAMRSTL